MRRLVGRRLLGECDDLGHLVRRDRCIAGLSGLVPQKAVHALLHEPFLPTPDARLGRPGPTHDRLRSDTVRRQQDDPRPPDMLLRRIAVADDTFQAATIGRGRGIAFEK